MNQTVLFVDDDPNLLSGVQRTLRREHYRVISATSGEQALALLATEAVDVVVSDEHMPGMGGLELLTTVHQQFPEIVSIMLSGQASTGTVVRALNQGQIFRFLIKPSGPDELCAAVQQALDHKLLLDRCRMMLPLFRRQAAVLQAIERQLPAAIAEAERAVAALIGGVTREDAVTIKELTDRMEVAISHAKPLSF